MNGKRIIKQHACLSESKPGPTAGLFNLGKMAGGSRGAERQSERPALWEHFDLPVHPNYDEAQ
jgi:hypothetical protein